MKAIYDTAAYLKENNKTVPKPLAQKVELSSKKPAEPIKQIKVSEDRTERLLKLAETNPELAGKIADFMKTESTGNVKPEREKIEITPEQKKYAKYLLDTYIIGGIIAISAFLSMLFAGKQFPAISFIIFFLTIISTIALSWYFTIQAGAPTIKSILSKYFKW